MIKNCNYETKIENSIHPEQKILKKLFNTYY